MGPCHFLNFIKLATVIIKPTEPTRILYGIICGIVILHSVSKMLEPQRSTEQVPVAEDDKSTKGVTGIAFGARSVSDRKVSQDVKAIIELIICKPYY